MIWELLPIPPPPPTPIGSQSRAPSSLSRCKQLRQQRVAYWSFLVLCFAMVRDPLKPSTRSHINGINAPASYACTQTFFGSSRAWAKLRTVCEGGQILSDSSCDHWWSSKWTMIVCNHMKLTTLILKNNLSIVLWNILPIYFTCNPFDPFYVSAIDKKHFISKRGFPVASTRHDAQEGAKTEPNVNTGTRPRGSDKYS